MDKILSILKDIRPDIDFENENKLVDGGFLDSFDIVSIISELNDTFDISIRVNDLTPANFNSLESIAGLVERLQNK